MSIERCEICIRPYDTDYEDGESLTDKYGKIHPICPICWEKMVDENGIFDFWIDKEYYEFKKKLISYDRIKSYLKSKETK